MCPDTGRDYDDETSKCPLCRMSLIRHMVQSCSLLRCNAKVEDGADGGDASTCDILGDFPKSFVGFNDEVKQIVHIDKSIVSVAACFDNMSTM